jgi:hypothetical protein
VITADQLAIHVLGDYVLQSHWCATEKTKRSIAAAIHVVLYALPFLLLTRSPSALAFIAGTHFAIDRWRLARLVVWAKNWLAPPGSNRRWSECQATGYGPDVPPWLAVWLLIIVDNLMHVALNAAAIRWL